MANTFLAYQGCNLGSSFIEKNFFPQIKKIEKKAKINSCKIILQIDVETASKIENPKKIVKCRTQKPIKSSKELASIISEAKKNYKSYKKDMHLMYSLLCAVTFHKFCLVMESQQH